MGLIRGFGTALPGMNQFRGEDILLRIFAIQEVLTVVLVASLGRVRVHFFSTRTGHLRLLRNICFWCHVIC